MFNLHDIHLSLSFSGWLFILGLLLLAAYSVYNYKYTIPAVTPAKKLLLTVIRALALTLVLFAIFEPVLRLAFSEKLEPEILFFVDNSRSINIKDGTNRRQTVSRFLSEASSEGLIKGPSLSAFGSVVTAVKGNDFERLSFNSPVTNFQKLFDSIKTANRNIASIVIMSDGVITDGPNPVYKAERLGIPVYALGLGDSARKNNVEVRRTLYNEYVYSGTPTTISTAVYSKGFSGRTAEAQLYEDGRPAVKQTFTLQDGITNLSFTYTPSSPGEKKMTVRVNPFPGEASTADNRNVFYLNVLNNKLNVLLVAGSPSPDLSFLRTILSADQNLNVRSITQAAGNKFLENVNQARLIDSADIFFLVGFPAANTPQNLLNRVQSEISGRNKPFFFVLSSSADLNRLRSLQSELPFNISRVMGGFSEAQPYVAVDESQNPLLQGAKDNTVDSWNNLPPVFKPNTEFQAKAESEVLARTRINNIPLSSPMILSRKLGQKRSVAILAKDIWKWKLQAPASNNQLLDNLVLSSVKWLNTRENQKPVTIRTTKKVYSPGETVEFFAQVYDATFNPVENAEVTVTASLGTDKFTVNMNPLGGGIYEGTLAANKPGDYTFSGEAKEDGRSLGRDNGRFSIGDIDIEYVQTSQDADFLKMLSGQTGGRYFYNNNYQALINTLKDIQKNGAKDKLTLSEFSLWSKEWLLGIIAFLFALEWFIRKRSGML